MEEQVIADPARVGEIAKELKQLEVKLAIDNFGRRYSAAEPQGAAIGRDQDRPQLRCRLRYQQGQCARVQDNDRSRPDFGSLAVAIGIEKASDAIALLEWAATAVKAFCSASRCRNRCLYRCCGNGLPGSSNPMKRSAYRYWWQFSRWCQLSTPSVAAASSVAQATTTCLLVAQRRDKLHHDPKAAQSASDVGHLLRVITGHRCRHTNIDGPVLTITGRSDVLGGER